MNELCKIRRRKGMFPQKVLPPVLEFHPLEPKKTSMPDAFAFTGLAATFSKAGFLEVLRRSETRPIMRYFIKEG